MLDLMVRDSIYTWEVAHDASQKDEADVSTATEPSNIHLRCCLLYADGVVVVVVNVV